MAFRGANRYENSLKALRAAGDIFGFVHPDYKYHKQDWDLIRDLLAGERRVKEMGPAYLPPLGNDTGATYASYKDRAVYVNMVARTVNGHIGTVFRRPLKVKGIAAPLRELFDSITLDGMSLNLLGKFIIGEVSAIGRIGLLLDRDAEGGSTPYIATYLAENILSWKETKINGRMQLSYVLLREIVENPRINTSGNFFSPANSPDQDNVLVARYRVLRLDENGEYIQEVYETNDIGNSYVQPAIDTVPTVTRPTRLGEPMRYIPMVIVGPHSPGSAVQRPPLLDIATLNLAHYRTSAQLEHGRFFTALPTYYIPTAYGSDEAEYVVGPSTVWEVAPGEKPGILEYYGTGLKALEHSLIEKEESISQLGGRIMGIRAAATSEAESIFKLKQANEMSVLLNMTESVSSAMTMLCRWYFDWEGNSAAARAVSVELNQDFKSLMVGAREMRAVSLLYQQGVLPVEEVYRVFQDAELISDDVSVEDFRRMLADPNQFPNQPNVDAMRDGWASAESRDSSKRKEAELASEEDIADKNRAAKLASEEDIADKNRAAKKTEAENNASSNRVAQFENRE